MNAQIKNFKKGFTIIEVVLVLAIAGLIFLMVFIALPALQRSQRDQARKNDVSIVASAVTSYVSNNQGKFPDTAALKSYVTDVSGNTDISLLVVSTNTNDLSPSNVPDGTIVVKPKVTCNQSSPSGQTFNRTGVTARQFAVITMLESGNKTLYCLNS